MSPTGHVTCEGFYKTDRDAQATGSKVVGGAKSCTQSVGGNTFGWCSCSDSVPRFVNQGSSMTTCDQLCEHTPSTYVSDLIPPLTGTPETKSMLDFQKFRMEKLAGALAAFLAGCALIVFHMVHVTGTKIGGQKALLQLVKATNIAPAGTKARPPAP